MGELKLDYLKSKEQVARVKGTRQLALYSLVPALFGHKEVLAGEIASDGIWR